MEKKPGFRAGIGAFFDGVGFIVSTAAMWPRAMVPMVIATLLIAVFGGFGIWGAVEAAMHIVGDDIGTWGAIGNWVLRILFGALAVVIAFLIAASLAQPLSGWALDGIVRRKERALGGREWPEHPFWPSTIRSLGVTLTGLAVSVPLLLALGAIDLLFPPAAIVCVPLKFVIGALLVAWDFMDYPMSLRGVSAMDRVRFIRANFRAVLGFGLSAMVLMLLPCIGLLVLPMGVAGATRLVMDLERAATSRAPA